MGHLNSQESSIARALTVVLVGTCATLLGAQQRTNPTQISRVQQLMRAAYPELIGRKLTVSMTLTDRFDREQWTTIPVIGVIVRRPTDAPSQDATPSEFAENEFLGGFCHVRPPGAYIENATFGGAYVHSRENRLLTETARANPSWTDADLQKALRSAGAKYGPADREIFLRELKIDRFAPVVGRIREMRANFSWRLGGRSGNDEIVRPTWNISIEADDPNHGRMCYGLAFEPIDGRLIHFAGRRCE